MYYFNGFSLQNEEELFKDLLLEEAYCVAGFSYGAQKAFEYVYHSKERVERLILLSPAFFQNVKPSFIRTQLRYFETEEEAYVQQFLANVTSPSSFDLNAYVKTGSKEELEALLTYHWEEEKIQEVLNRGTVIEVFLAEKDKIIDTEEAYTFFSSLTATYFFKDKGHLLR
jgi:pimeloyl-ACP methyl ester carboxylesterase